MSRKCRSCGTPPQPYYANDKNSVTQDHAAIFRDTQYAAGVKIKDEFVVPQIDEDVQVCSKELVNLVVGSYLWNPAYGYLKIAHWDSCTGKIGLLNDDISGAAIPGTVVAECSLWAVTARPCCADEEPFSLLPFLAEDYVIPAVSDSVVLTVTSTYGLIEGTDVRIGTNVYSLFQINSATEIIVVNQGAGGIPGDIVLARDINGDLQYLITQAVVSSCSNTGVPEVRLLGCDGADGAILEGTAAGQVPVLQDPNTDEVQFQFLDAGVRVCTVLTANFDILAATINYTIEVADESIFTIGQVIEVQGVDLRWEIISNLNPGELDISCTTGAPGITTTVVSGRYVCLQLCCESTTERIVELEADVVVLESDVATLQTEVSDLQAIVDDGWLPLADVGTYISATQFTVLGNLTGPLKKGQKLKLFLAGSEFYANIASFNFFLGLTTITIIENLDQILTNNPITAVEISYQNPPDFPEYFNYDCTPSGFSVITLQRSIYWVIEGTIFGKAVVSGTSDSIVFQIALPAPTALDPVWGFSSVNGIGSLMVDNSIIIANPGRLLQTGSPLFNLYRNNALGAWTASGTKSGTVDFNYPIG